MDGGLKLPLDFESWQELRDLKRLAGSAPLALFAYVRLWVELGYQVQSTQRLGFMSSKAMGLFDDSVVATTGALLVAGEGARAMRVEVGSLLRQGYGGQATESSTFANPPSLEELRRTGATADGHPPGTTPGEGARPTTWRGWFEEAGIFMRVEGGWECARFARCNPHLAPDWRPGHVKGADASRFVRGVRKFENRAMSESLLIPEDRWVKGDGTRMSSEEIKRVMMVIKAVDLALGRRDRANNGADYSEGLVRDAWQVCADYLGETVERVCRWLLDNRGRAAVPGTAEQVLARFGEIARMVR